MCGRYALTLPPETVRARLGYREHPNFPARHNIAPTQPVPVVRAEGGARRFALMRWGFLPGFVKDPKRFPLVINVRSETVREKPSFRAAFVRRRALMPADGFYEWAKEGRTSRPFLLRRPDRGVFAFPAIFETYADPEGGEIDTVALLNTHANGLLSAIHPRSPVILDPSQFDAWLDPATSPERAHALLQPPPDDLLEMVEIGRAVNKVSNDGPEVQAPAAAGAAPEDVPAPHANPVRAEVVPKERPARTKAGAGAAAPAEKQPDLF